MVYFTSFNKNKKENLFLKSILQDVAAYMTDEKWNMTFFEEIDEFLIFFRNKPLVNISCHDILAEGSIEALLEVRESYQDTLLILIADINTPPTMYLRPGIKADSLLLRPLSLESTKNTIKDVVRAYNDKVEHPNSSNSLIIEDKDGKQCIPYKTIYYFEAKEKKVFVRTLNDEFGFYSTLDKLEEVLPEEFCRSHRGFIVNVKKISKIFLSLNTIDLLDGFHIPLSRSYKPLFKDL